MERTKRRQRRKLKLLNTTFQHSSLLSFVVTLLTIATILLITIALLFGLQVNANLLRQLKFAASSNDFSFDLYGNWQSMQHRRNDNNNKRKHRQQHRSLWQASNCINANDDDDDDNDYCDNSHSNYNSRLKLKNYTNNVNTKLEEINANRNSNRNKRRREQEEFRVKRTTAAAAAAAATTTALSVNDDSAATKLYEDLMNPYNKYVRPVKEVNDILVVKLGLRLAQIIEVNLKSQLMTTSVWVEHQWTDSKLKWDPDDYGGVSKLHIPALDIWRPDIVLYNNADGDYVITTMNKATVHYNGTVEWVPPAIFKSSCNIDVSYFPFDTQTCILKFGTWSYNGNYIELRHLHQPDVSSTRNSTTKIELGIDLTDFLLSVEWDVMSATAIRHESAYSCCVGSFYDVIFYLDLRRKPLFYTVNLIVPCVVMSFISILVFYMPASSNEKVSLTISIVVSVDVFLLALIEMIPPTSFVVSLLGEYLIFTLCLVTLSVFATIYVLNISFRNPSSHKMSKFQRTFFLQILPKLLLMKTRNSQDEVADEMARAKFVHCTHLTSNSNNNNNCNNNCNNNEVNQSQQQKIKDFATNNNNSNNHQQIHLHRKHKKRKHKQRRKSSSITTSTNANATTMSSGSSSNLQATNNNTISLCGLHKEVTNAFLSLDFVAKRMENRENFMSIEEDWRYMSTVLDRLLLILFTFVWFVGTVVILLQAPTLYDNREPIDVKQSKFASRMRQQLSLSS